MKVIAWLCGTASEAPALKSVCFLILHVSATYSQPVELTVSEDIQHVVLSVDRNASKFLLAMPGNIYVPLNCQPCGSFSTLTSLHKFSSLSYERQTDSFFFFLLVCFNPKSFVVVKDFKQIQIKKTLCEAYKSGSILLRKFLWRRPGYHKPNKVNYKSVSNRKKTTLKESCFIPAKVPLHQLTCEQVHLSSLITMCYALTVVRNGTLKTKATGNRV